MLNTIKRLRGYSIQVIQINEDEYGIRLQFDDLSDSLPLGGWLPEYDLMLDLKNTMLYVMDLGTNAYDLDLGQSPNILGKHLLTGTLAQMNKMVIFMDENWL